MKRRISWILLVIALLAWARLMGTSDTFTMINSVVFVVCIILYFICRPEMKRRKERRYQQERAERIQACCDRLAAKEAELRRRFEAGELRFVVEWWEEDDLYIDENAHMFFRFTDDTTWEIDLYTQVQEQLKPLLYSFGIAWEPGFNIHFGSRILYPPTHAGQPFYNSDGSVRKELMS